MRANRLKYVYKLCFINHENYFNTLRKVLEQDKLKKNLFIQQQLIMRIFQPFKCPFSNSKKPENSDLSFMIVSVNIVF